MRKYIFLAHTLLLTLFVDAQSLTIEQPFQMVPNSSVLASYKNQFGAWERHGGGDTFPYSVIRVRLNGNAREVISAKQILNLNLYPAGYVEFVYKDMENELLFLIPSSVQRIEMTCGDNCLQQTILDLPSPLQSNTVYLGSVHFVPAEEKVAEPVKKSTPRRFFHFYLNPDHAVVKVNVDGKEQMWQTKNGDAYSILNDGTYFYTVSAVGYQTQTGNITVSGASNELQVVLIPQTIRNSNVIDVSASVASNAIDISSVDITPISSHSEDTIISQFENVVDNLEETASAAVSQMDIPIKNTNVADEEGDLQSVKDIEASVTEHIYINGNAIEKKTFNVNGVDLAMIKVVGGTFSMGATEEQDGEGGIDEGVHNVILSDYYIGQTEVSQSLWKAVMGTNPSMFDNNLSHPVESVTWNDCQQFLQKLTDLLGEEFRLPTEAEWEYAARGGKYSSGYKYAGSNVLDDIAWYDGNSEFATQPIATKAANELGLYDMSGNVYEWCSDWYGGYMLNAQRNPQGAASGRYRVYRGGGCYSKGTSCRASYRHNGSPDHQDGGLGLRIVMAIDMSAEMQTQPDSVTDEIVQMIAPNESARNSSPSIVPEDVVEIPSIIEVSMAESLPSIEESVSSLKTGPQEFTVNGVSFRMIQVLGGAFTMGATIEHIEEAEDDEKPAHKVSLSNYYIGQTEVTQALWEAVMGSNPSEFILDAKCPVENVSWDDCQLFIQKLNALTGENFRLPTEAEWEYAARGGSNSAGHKFAGNANIEKVAWYDEISDGKTHPVAKKNPNELGLYDMSGNVSEWCYDGYDKYSSIYQQNPKGLATTSNRIYRGGSWDDFSGFCRVSYRNYDVSSTRSSYVGLRLAL